MDVVIRKMQGRPVAAHCASVAHLSFFHYGDFSSFTNGHLSPHDVKALSHHLDGLMLRSYNAPFAEELFDLGRISSCTFRKSTTLHSSMAQTFPFSVTQHHADVISKTQSLYMISKDISNSRKWCTRRIEDPTVEQAKACLVDCP